MLSVLFAVWYLCPSLGVDSHSSAEFLQYTTSSSNQGKLEGKVLKMSDDEARALECAGRGVCVKDHEVLKMIDSYDRPGNAFAAGTYAGAGTFEDKWAWKPGKRIPKAGAYAAAGVGYARAEWSVCDAEVKGPNASAGVGASWGSGARAFAKAELASASAAAGPVKATVALGLETGVGVGLSSVEVKLLGTGVCIGPTLSISLFGSSIELNLW